MEIKSIIYIKANGEHLIVYAAARLLFAEAIANFFLLPSGKAEPFQFRLFFMMRVGDMPPVSSRTSIYSFKSSTQKQKNKINIKAKLFVPRCCL